MTKINVVDWAESMGLVEQLKDQTYAYYVSLYRVEQCYGGPEEGGWWYDLWTIVRYKPVQTENEGYSLVEKMHELIRVAEGQEPYVDRFASLPDEDEVPCPAGYPEGYIPTGFSSSEKLQAVVEEYPGENRTKEIPHYE